MKNNSPEVGLFQRLFIALQCPLHMGVHGYGIVQDRQDFRIVIMIMLQHFIDILLHLSNFLSIFPHVVTHDPQSFRQISFFRLTAYISLHTALLSSVALSFSCPSIVPVRPHDYNQKTLLCRLSGKFLFLYPKQDVLQCRAPYSS